MSANWKCPDPAGGNAISTFTRPRLPMTITLAMRDGFGLGPDSP